MSFFAGYVLTTGVVHRADLAHVVAVEKESQDSATPRSRLVIRKGEQWLEPVDLEWNARSCVVCKEPAERLLLMSEEGYIAAAGGGKVVVERRIAPGGEMPGPLTELGVVSGIAFAVGTCRQVYQRAGDGVWTRADLSCRASGPHAGDFAFRCLDGFGKAEIYAAGWGGEIWSYGGATWMQRASPTNLAIFDLCCAPDGSVYGVGQRGLVIQGRGDDWSVVHHGATEDDLWSCEWHDGKLYMASLHLVYVLEEGQVRPVDWGGTTPPATCYRLSSAAGRMWSIGASDILQLKDGAWSHVSLL